jgi:hypothetical protein
LGIFGGFQQKCVLAGLGDFPEGGQRGFIIRSQLGPDCHEVVVSGQGAKFPG